MEDDRWVPREQGASLCEDMMNDHTRFYEFCEDMPELAQKLAAVLDRVIRTFKQLVNGQYGKNTWMLGNDVEELEAIRDSWYAMLKEASDAQKAGIAGEESVEAAAMYSLKRTSKMSWEDQVERYSKGDWEGGDHFDLGKSGNLYSELGMSNADIGMRSGVIKKATDKKGKKGNLSVLRNDFYKDLKEWIMHPAALIDEPERNSVAVITGEKNEYGFPIVAYIDKNKQIDYWPAHELTSVYGLQNIGKLIQSAKENGAKIKICDNEKLQGLSLENVLTMNASFTNLATNESISNSDAGVNPLNMKQLKERDEAYQSAVESGDTEAQRNLVKTAASIAGYIPVTRYHQTGERFTEFSTDNLVAGQYDSATPNGIFLKDNDHDIGVGGDYVNTGHGGDIQMELYIKADNMLRFGNRDSATRWYKENIPGYGELYDEMRTKLDEISAEVEALEDKYYYEEALSEEEFEQKWDELVHGKLKPIEDTYRSKLRGILNDYFLTGESRYDGIELIYDGSRYIDGKKESVHTYIVFNANQVKSADPITYDDNGNVIPLSERFDIRNNDIRYDLKDTDEQKSFGYNSRYLRDELYDLWGYRQRPSDYTYEQYYDEHLNEWQSKSRVRDNMLRFGNRDSATRWYNDRSAFCVLASHDMCAHRHRFCFGNKPKRR